MSAQILIVEDEFIISDDLKHTLQDFGHTVVATAETATEAITALQQHSIDLVLLDINLNEPIDGVQIAQIINAEYKLPFLYVTAFTDPKTLDRVKHTNPYGYVVKPYNESDLKIAIDLALHRHSQQSAPVIHNNNQESTSKKAIYIKTHQGLERFILEEILSLEAYDYYAYIYTSEKRTLATMTLKELIAKINSDDFIRIHRSHVININHIDKVVGNQVEVGQRLIPVGRTHKETLMKKLESGI